MGAKVTILHTYLEGKAARERQWRTEELLASMQGDFLRERWKVAQVPVGDDRRYERAFRRHYGLQKTGTLVTIERDMYGFTWEVLKRLVECSFELCAQVYHHVQPRCCIARVGEKSTCLTHGVPEAIQSYTTQRIWIDRVQRKSRWARESDEWVDLAGFGLTKFSLSFRRRHPLDTLERGTWRDLDTRFSIWASDRGERFHLHRPRVENYHPSPIEHEGVTPYDELDPQEKESLSGMIKWLRENNYWLDSWKWNPGIMPGDVH